MKNVGLCLVAAAVLGTGAILAAQQHQANSSYNPGIRPDTPESVQAEKAAETAWFAHLQVLAGDELKGRRTGTPEFLRAVEYVESQFKAIGLKPAGKEGFRQPVGFHSVRVDAEHSSFALVKQGGQSQNLTLGSEITLSPRTDGVVSVDAPAVFAGYGLQVPALGLDDLHGLDLHGKVAVIFAGSPTAVHGPLKAYFRTTAARWKTLRAAGAVGVISIPDLSRLGASAASAGAPAAGQGTAGGRASAAGASGSPAAPGAAAPAGSGRVPVSLSDPQLDSLLGAKLSATLPRTSAAVLFEGAPHSFEELQSLAAKGQTLPSFPLGVTIRATTASHEADSIQSPNVAAILEGSDPQLKHEYLALSAHLDHLGIGREVNGDSIYNGAMDNGAGIASLIETAKALAAGPRPKRSIIFLAYTGEEEGELGSQYYARYTTVPRAQIVANLNMDMYLPLFPLRFLEVQGLGESTLGDDARAAAQLNDIEVQFDKQPDENRFIRSDQASFVKYGIPALAFKFGWLPDTPEQKTFNNWIKNTYHHANDDLNQPIDKEAAVHFDRVLLTLARRVANAPSRPRWYPESFFSTVPRS